MLFSSFFPFPYVHFLDFGSPPPVTEFLYNFRYVCEGFDNNWVKKSIFQVLSVDSPQKSHFHVLIQKESLPRFYRFMTSLNLI